MTGETHHESDILSLRLIVEAAAADGPLEGLLDVLTSEAVKLPGLASATLWRFQGEDAVCVSAEPLDPGGAAANDLALDRAHALSVRTTGTRYGSDARPGWQVRAEGATRASVLIALDDRTWGALVLRAKEGQSLERYERRIAHFAAVAGASVLTACERGVLRRRAKEQEAFGRLATMIARLESEDAILAGVAEEVAGLLELEVGAVGRFEGAEAVLVACWTEGSFPGGGDLDRVPLEEETVLSRIFRTRAPARVDDYRRLRNPMADAVASAGVLSSVGAPVFVDQRLWGAVVATSPRTAVIPADAEERLVRYSELVGVAIANSEHRVELERRAATDPLTQLANHQAFHERLGEELERSRRHGRPLALAIFDLDHFKRVNDEHGHDVGDRVLREASHRLRDQTRPGDLIARVGGEEFAWILPDCDALDAWHVAERARASISEEPFVMAGRLTISAGVCGSDVADTDAEALFRLADKALYWAKSSGRNRCFRYDGAIERSGTAAERQGRLGRMQTLDTMLSLARIVDAKDPSTRRHSERVADLAVRLGTALGWPVERLARLREAGLLHDVGKIGIADAVLCRPGRLTPEELAQIRLHPGLGAQMVQGALDEEQVTWLRAHHERPDGTGYPEGLLDEGIPVGARILAVAEAWDAIISGGPHVGAMSPESALDEVRRCAGTQFCPQVVAALERLFGVGLLGEAPA